VALLGYRSQRELAVFVVKTCEWNSKVSSSLRRFSTILLQDASSAYKLTDRCLSLASRINNYPATLPDCKWTPKMEASPDSQVIPSVC